MPTKLPPFPILPPPTATTPPPAPRGEESRGQSNRNSAPHATDRRDSGGTWGEYFSVRSGANSARAAANETARRAVEYQHQRSAENWAPPIIYGKRMVGAHILAWAVVNSTLYISAGWCLGEIDSIVEVYDRGQPLAASVAVTHYTGTTTQTADATLASVISGYADTNVFSQSGQSVGVAYSVLAFPTGSTPGFPQLSAIVQGLKIGVGGAYTTNPARFLADFISNDVYGEGTPVNAASITDAAAWCDDDIGGGVKRIEASLTIDARRRTKDWIEVLKSYAMCFVVREAGEVKLVPDKAGSSVRSITAADMLQGSFVPSKRSLQQAPTAVTVSYTDTSKVPWRDAHATAQLAGVDTGATPLRESPISLPGILDYGTAYRWAVTRLNGLNLVDLDCQWVSFDEQLDLEIGDIIDVTHPFGLTAKLMRVSNIQPAGRSGLWRIFASEHDDAIYSNDIASQGSAPDSSLPSPSNPPAVDSITFEEEVFIDQAGRTLSRFIISWAGVNWPFALQYRYVVAGSGLAMSALETHLGAETHSVTTPPVKQGVEYSASIFTISTTGHKSPPTVAMQTALGKFLVPGNVMGFTGFEAGQFVSLAWDQVIDIGVVKYRVKRGLATDTWSTAATVKGGAAISATNFLIPFVPAGTWRFFIKAFDDVGLFSTDAVFKDIIVTADEGGDPITDDLALDISLLVDMHSYELHGDGVYAITDGAKTFTNLFSTTWAAASTQDAWFKNHDLSDTANCTSHELDIGSDRTGRFRYDAEITGLGTGHDIITRIRTSTAAAYPIFSGTNGQDVRLTARYMEAKFRDATIVNTGAMLIKFPVSGQFIGEIVTQSGAASVPASPQPLAISFATSYSTTPEVKITLSGSTPRIIARDAVTTAGFDLYAWDSGGVAAAATIDWEASGS